jgi:hypothetical protein
MPSSVDPYPDQQRYILDLAHKLADMGDELTQDEAISLGGTFISLLLRITRDAILLVSAELQNSISFWTTRLQSPWLAWLVRAHTYTRHLTL